MRQTDLVLLYSGGSSSSDRGVAYPVVLRNPGSGTFWDVAVRTTHDGEETDRQLVRRLGPRAETDQLLLLIPAQYCDGGTAGLGRRPRGHVVAEALVDDEIVAAVDLPGGADDPEIDRVPRTRDEEATLLRVRPDAWEFLLFAAVLRRRMEDLEPKYRDHQLRFTRPTPGGGPVQGDELSFLSSAFAEAGILVANVNRVLDATAQERAFGPLGSPGDEVQIEHLGQRLIDVYEGLLDWAARLRSAPVDDEFEQAVELASRFVDDPIQQFRDFVTEVVAETDRLPTRLRNGEDVRLTVTLAVDIEAGLEKKFRDELARLASERGVAVDWDT